VQLDRRIAGIGGRLHNAALPVYEFRHCRPSISQPDHPKPRSTAIFRRFSTATDKARRNRDTINQKLSYIKVAQRRFFNGLVVLGLLLMLDPISRFGLLDASRNRLGAWTSRLLERPITAPATALDLPAVPAAKAVPQSPAKFPKQP
jgi:hypothetical protein